MRLPSDIDGVLHERPFEAHHAIIRSAAAPDVQRIRLLAAGGNAWHLVEFGVALAAGVAAGSVALVAFGGDSLTEAAAGFVILWRFRSRSESAERRAQQMIAASYGLLVVYVAVEATRALVLAERPHASWVGIGLAAFAAATMPLLAAAKRRAGRRVGSAATVGEAGQNLICAYLSVALLAGLLLNAIAGWWWADPAAALVVGAVAAREAVEVWTGEDDCC